MNDAIQEVPAQERERCLECQAPEPHCDCEPDDDEAGDCYWCGGDGWRECDDPLQCTSPHNRLGECRCSSCGGSGDARDMTIW